MGRQATKRRKRARQQALANSLTKLAPGLVLDKAGVIGVHKALDAYSNVPANLGLGATNLSQTGRYIMERFLDKDKDGEEIPPMFEMGKTLWWMHVNPNDRESTRYVGTT